MKNMSDNEILESVLAEFKEIAKIPRPSLHEKQISDYLKDYFNKLGFETIQDEVNNIIVNIPASKGFENAPLTILQAHMDMVAVAAEGVPFDPLTSPIHLLREEDYLRAMGTSLGADDGMGIAIIMFLAKNLKKHGALRLIFTVDEETGMKGAKNLDEKYLKDAKYLINCDSEDYDEIVIGCAGSVTMEFTKEIKREAVTKNNIVTVELTGLMGGHSGERIGDNRANAILALLRALRNLKNYGENEFISIEGGSARNAIPSFARAILATDIDRDMLKIALMEEGRSVYKIYGEENAEFVIKNGETNFGAICEEDTEKIFQFANLIHSGVYVMSVNNMVETSANLGLMSVTENSVNFSLMPRSSCDKKLDIFISQGEDLAALTGFTMTHSGKFLGWSQKDSKLATIMADKFKQITGKDMTIKEIHAGLECGYHYMKNPQLDIVSIGTSNIDIHSPRERVLLSTVAPITRLVGNTLDEIARG